jgi:hypothetical protein
VLKPEKNAIMDEEFEKRLLDQATLLVERLERISPDSSWAHRVSGYRGSLLKMIEQIEQSRKSNNGLLENDVEFHCLERLVETGFVLLGTLAKELVR